MKRWRRYIVWCVLGVVLLTAVVLGWQGVRLWLAWRGVEQFSFDLDASRDRLAPRVPPAPATSLPPPTTLPVPLLDLDDSDIDVFLIVGTDADKPSAALQRADAILLFVRPHEQYGPLLTPLPRDLVVENPCSGTPSRISTVLEGCADEVSGPELLALTVEDFTGLSVDHFAVLSFEAVIEAVDAIGGVEFCVDNPVRFSASEVRWIEKPAGCSRFDGVEALLWVRHRTSQELVDGEWRFAEGGDATRSERQQQLLLELLARLRSFRSPIDLAGIAEDIADAIAIDDDLTLAGAVDLAWDLRGLRPSAIVRASLPVVDGVTPDGQFARVPQLTFAEFLRTVYAGASG